MPSCADVAANPIALGAVRHDLLVAYYHVVRDRVAYRDLGANWQHKRCSGRAGQAGPPKRLGLVS